jgi:hypothetical protein
MRAPVVVLRAELSHPNQAPAGAKQCVEQELDQNRRNIYPLLVAVTAGLAFGYGCYKNAT